MTQVLFKISLVLLIFSSTIGAGYAQKSVGVVVAESGVSEKLAQQRKKTINDIGYQLRLNIPAGKQETIAADEIISFNLKNNQQPLEIDFKEQRDHIKSVAVNMKEIPVVFEKEHILVDTKFLKTGSNTVAIQFIAGNLSLNRNEDYLYTLLVPDRARTVFPCFDQPNLKASFTLSLNLPANWKALCNAPLKDSSATGDRKLYNYAASDTISTYLFSFAAGKFDEIEKEVNGRTMHFYHRENDTNKIRLSVDSVFRIHADAIHFLENYTQIPYPFKKFDFVAIPDFQYGGMEHVGAIQYQSSSLFLDSAATKDQENSRANLIAHETSHMWFGDLVTMQWFNDVWMKEVFANFMADKITQDNNAGNSYELRFLIDHFPAAYGVDRTPGANPIRQQLTNLQEAGNLYGNIIYHKAPIMMRQLERLMGKDSFRDGLREYLAKYKLSNATWPDLIKIFDEKTPADLNEWNRVWVNQPGRPEISYQIQQQNEKISKFTLHQKAENGSQNLLPQFFEIALVYADTIEEFTAKMDKQDIVLKTLEGKPLPRCILFNSSGQGYGLFPVDDKMISQVSAFKNPVMRASAYINLYENMLSGKSVTPLQLIDVYKNMLTKEPEELNLRLITGDMSDIFWRLIPTEKRDSVALILEKDLWQTMNEETVANKKKILFKTFQSIALSKAAKDSLYAIWKNEKAPSGVKLAEEDYTSLALTLAVKDYPAEGILNQQLARIKNIDRKKRLQFIMPALSANVSVRDSFFTSLLSEKNREKEAWVTAALSYLHHPLRAETSEKYLKQSLEVLQEIQLTGDIFFPAAWLQSTFGSYHSTKAANVVRTFLKDYPNYNAKLKAKILQATDPLFRAEKLLSGNKK